jgi:hypothetical protein
VLKIFSDVEEEKEVASSDCIEPSFVPKKVLWYMEFSNNLVSKLEIQEGLTRGVHDNVQKENM